MERLTYDGNFCDIAQCAEIPGGNFCEDGACSQKKVWERLKAYEDTGMSPQACEGVMLLETALSGVDYSVSRMVELMCADKEGRVHILPKSENGTCGICAHFRRIVGTCSGRCDIRPYPVDRWGHANLHGGAFMPAQSRKACKHYLTHEETEQALERSRDNEWLRKITADSADA